MSTTSSTDDSLRGFDRLNGSNYPTWEYAATLDLTVHDLWDLFDADSADSVPPPAYVTAPTSSAAASTAISASTTPAPSTASTTSTASTASTATVAPPAQAGSTLTPNPDYIAWRKRATKATARLVKLVDTAHMHLIMARETPLEQWRNLAEVFSERTAEAILAKRTRLCQMRWDPSGDTPLQAFLQSMIAIGTELARANHPVSPIDMCGFIGMAMPDGLRQSVSTLKRIGRLTPETWVRDLVEDERAFGLHKPGAVARAGRVETGERRNRPRGECWKCHGKGHVQKDCPTISEEERQALRKQHEDRQRARGNGRLTALENKLSTIRAKAAAAGVALDGEDDVTGPSPRVYGVRVGATSPIKAQPQQPGPGSAGTADHVVFTGGADDDQPVRLTHARAAAALNDSVDPGLVILDSGCTRHVTSDRASLVNYRPLSSPRKVMVADEGTVDAIGVGDLCVWTRPVRGKAHAMTVFKSALYVPGIIGTLISVRQLCGGALRPVKVLFYGDHCEVWGGNELELRCELIDDLYVIERMPPPPGPASSVSPTHHFLLRALKAKPTTSIHPETAHRRLGHLNMNNVRHIARDGLLGGFDIKKDGGSGTCEPCLLGKARRLPFHSRPRCDTPLKLVHSDLVGPFEVETTGRARYFVVFRDDHTRVGSAYLIRNKSDAFEKFKEWRAWAERSLQLRVQGLHSDNGGEFIGNDFEAYLRDNNIEYSRSHAHTPQENGLAERYNGIILSIMRTILQESGLPSRFWGEAVKYAAYTINFRPSAALDGQVPMAVWTKSAPDASHLRSFGCDAYCYLLPDSARQKSKPTAVKCKLMGYTRTGYRVWDPANRRFRESKHVVCVENYGGEAGELIPPPSEDALARAYDMSGPDGNGWENVVPDAAHRRPDPPDLVQEILQLPPDDAPPLADIPVIPVPEDLPVGVDAPEPGFEDLPEPAEPVEPAGLRRSGRERRAPERLRDMVPSGPLPRRRARANATRTNLELLDAPTSDPKNVREALASDHSAQWQEAIGKENRVLIEMGTFEVVDTLPDNAKAVGSRYAFKYKPNGTFKARLVAQGFSQRPGIDYALTFSPVTKSPSIRLVYALAALHNLLLFTADFVSAFLNGELKEEIYLRAPEGGDESWIGKYLRLIKSIYGLKQAARVWWENVEAMMLELGFERASSDWCLFVRRRDGKVLLVAVHVDDMLGAASDEETWNSFCTEMDTHFKIKNLGRATEILGTEVTQDLEAGTITISSRRYLEDIVKRFNMWDAKPVATPLDPGVHLSHEDNPSSDLERTEMSRVPYLAAVGSVLYAAGATRPDISHAATFLARFSANPGRKHWQALKRVLAYLRHTLDHGITYRHDGNADVYGYTDADHGGCLDTARSTSGYVFILAGGAVTWSSKRQTTVSESTLEAEYIAAAHASKEAMWLQYCLSDIGFPTSLPIPIRCDNNGAITITLNPAEHQRTKHMHRKYHYIRERAAAGDISLIRCDTNNQLADYLTKPVPRDKFIQCISRIGVQSRGAHDIGGSDTPQHAHARDIGLGGSVTNGPT